MLMSECTILLLPLDIGNKSGVVGCGVWNDNCGGLNLAIVWQIAYCIIAALVVVVMPFFMFYYENDDEGMESAEKGEGSCLTGCMVRCVLPPPRRYHAPTLRACGAHPPPHIPQRPSPRSFQSFKRSFFSALCYTLVSLTFGVIGFFVMHRYIGFR